MDPISLEELALLDVLERIDQWLEHGPNAGPMRVRLVEVGLAEDVEGTLRLTDAGIERCKSLHHRVKADAEAELVLLEREKAGDSNDTQG
ncbi:MAG: hypothetical protein ACREPE_04855 [Lysobacter sp.]